MLKALILEDELPGYNNLKNLLQQHCPEVEIIGHARTIEQGLFLLNQPNFQPHIAFLDINLPDGLVFQMLDQLDRIKFELIFVTGHDTYAIKACEYGSIGYLTKPIDADMLEQYVKNITTTSAEDIEERYGVTRGHYQNEPNAFRKLVVPAMEATYVLDATDIRYLEGFDNCTYFHLHNEENFLVARTIGHYEKKLIDFNFQRIHKKYVINLNNVHKITPPESGGGGFSVLKTGEKLTISRRRRKPLLDRLASL